MEHRPQPDFAQTGSDAVRQLAQLAHVRSLVEHMAGRGPAEPRRETALDHGARISAAYDEALPVAQKRFDALAAETATWAAAAAQALLGGGPGDPPRAAAAHLADELARAQRAMEGMLGL